MTAEKITLAAQKRTETGKLARKLRQKGLLPGVIYGQNKANQLITVDQKALAVTFQKAGETGLIYLELGETKIPSLIRELQVSPYGQKNLHVDFMAVNLAEKVEADIPLVYAGDAPAVVDQDGTLIEVKKTLHVEALPTDLVHEIIVDVSALANFDDILHVKDIQLPQGIIVLDDSEETLATVEPPRSEEELAELEAKPAEEAEVIAAVESATQEGTTVAPPEGEGKKEE